jgi:polar amino acid transport system substrate-binding protein
MKHIILRIIILVTVLTAGGVVNAQHLVFSTLEGHSIVIETMTQVMTEAYGRIGMTIEVECFPGERSIHMANEGKVDGELFRKKEGIEVAYPHLIKVPVCIHIGDFVVFTRDKLFAVDGWGSLRPYSVGYQRGVKAVEMNLVKGTRAEPVATMAQAFRKLALGRTDVVIDFRPNGMGVLKNLSLNEIRVLEPPILRVESFHYLHVKNRHLLAPLTEALYQMECEGLFQDIRSQVEQKYR